MEEDQILEEIDRTELCEHIRRLRELYGELAEKQKVFCDSFSLHCVEGCGTCCAHFVPDVTDLEADFLAVGLIAEGKEEQVLEQLRRAGERPERCLFYEPEGKYHCTVYRWRPLICRLFGASVYEGKDGNPVYRRCKWNTEAPVLTPEQLQAKSDILVLMSEYGLMVDECDAGDTERTLLPEALPRAIAKVELVRELENEEKQE